MSYPRFYAGDLAGNVYTMSLTEDANYPLSNLSTYIPTDEWRSSANTNSQTLKIDFGIAKAIDTLILDSHNINLMTLTALQYDATDNPSFAIPVSAIAELQVFSPTGLIDKFEFNSVRKRYWRLLFSDTNTLVPRIGQIFLSGKFDAAQPYDEGYRGGNKQHETEVQKSLSGVERASQAFAGKTVFEISFSIAGETFRTNWIAFHNKVRGKLCPFYFADMDDAIYLVKFEQDYNPAETIRYQVNNVQTVTLRAQ
jgi:hypothetical protein